MMHLSRTVLHVLSALMMLLLLVVVPVQAQETTEQYIPIGYSPGVSGKYSYVGRITAMDHSARTLTVGDGDNSHVIKLSDATRIWLDRSKVRQPNRVGDYEDCKVGRRIEVMYVDDSKEFARWIKIETT